jgi:hypothetical protein
MDRNKLTEHIKLCRRNLKSERVICCGNCPFEEDIIGVYPELIALFEEKRKTIKRRNHAK